MRKELKYYIKNIESRVKRLEESIIASLSIVTNVLCIDEKVGMSDSIIIHSRIPNNTFFVGYSEIGTDYIGDLRGAPVLVYSG